MKNPIVMIVGLVVSQNLMAASIGSILLSGTVAVVNEVVITANGSHNTSLNITGGESGKNIASVLETSNNPEGYVITLCSDNAGELRHSNDSSQKTTYSVSYDGGSYQAPPACSNALEVKSVSSMSGLGSDTSQILVNVTAFPLAPAGSYSDSLTISIAAN